MTLFTFNSKLNKILFYPNINYNDKLNLIVDYRFSSRESCDLACSYFLFLTINKTYDVLKNNEHNFLKLWIKILNDIKINEIYSKKCNIN